MNFIKKLFLKNKAIYETESTDENLNFCRNSNYPKNSCDAQWMLLYSCISSIEDTPNEIRLKSIKNFINNIPDQCKFTELGEVYTENIKEYEDAISKAKTKRELLLLLCTIENKCRAKLGKQIIPCRYTEIMNRWNKNIS